MKKLLLLSLLLLLVANPAYAFCDLERLPFGEGIEDIVEKYDYDLDDPIAPEEEGSNILLINGNKICNDFNERSVAVIEFIDDKMIKIAIKDKSGDGTILEVVEKNFGKVKDSEKKKDGSFDKVWGEQSNIVVVYSTKFNKEYLAVTSKKYRDLFKKHAKDSDKRHDKKGDDHEDDEDDDRKDAIKHEEHRD